MPTPPTTPSSPASAKSTSAKNAPAAPASPAGKKAVAKKVAVQPNAAEGTLVDKSVQKTTRKATTKAKPKATSSFEKPAEAEWHRMISEAAYYRAERRGFQSGYEQEDWAWAVEEVRKILSP